MNWATCCSRIWADPAPTCGPRPAVSARPGANGPAIDTQDLCYELTHYYQDELHRPAFPYKFKFKFDGCPNCCVASIARADMSFIGTWRDDIRIDQEAVKAYIGGEIPPNGGAHAGKDWGKFDIQKEVIDLCPTQCMWMEDGKLMIDDKECTRCMHCINVMPQGLEARQRTPVSASFSAQRRPSLKAPRCPF